MAPVQNCPNQTIVSFEFLLRDCRTSRDCWLEGTLADFGIRSITRWWVRRHSLYNLQWYLKDTWGEKRDALCLESLQQVFLQGISGCLGGNAFKWNKKLINSLIGIKMRKKWRAETYHVGGLFPKLPQQRQKAACALLSSVPYLSFPFFITWKISHPAFVFRKN